MHRLQSQAPPMPIKFFDKPVLDTLCCCDLRLLRCVHGHTIDRHRLGQHELPCVLN